MTQLQLVTGYQSTGHQSFQNGIKGILSLLIWIEQHALIWIASFSTDEIPKIKQKFLNADWPNRFISSVINNFQEKSEGTDDYIVPPGFFDVWKKVLLVDIICFLRNKEFSRRFIKKFDVFTDNKFETVS